MAELVPETIHQEKINVEPSKVTFKPLSSLELILDKSNRVAVDQKLATFNIFLRLPGNTEFQDYIVYFSPQREQAEKQYQQYLHQLQSGEYRLTFDRKEGTATIDRPPLLRK